MRVIQLDGSAWKKPLDFYQALFDGIEQGHPHGLGVNAFIDSMVWRGMGGVEPPYTILVTNLAGAPKEVCDEVTFMISAVQEARRERVKSEGVDVEVSISAPELAS